jgi:hypothetical protein
MPRLVAVGIAVGDLLVLAIGVGPAQLALVVMLATAMALFLGSGHLLARGTIRAIRLEENVPDEVAGAVRDLAAAVRALADAVERPDRADRVREPALRAAATATLVLERTGNLSVSVIIGQIRSTATDLIAGTGMSADTASEAVTRAAREAAEAAR